MTFMHASRAATLAFIVAALFLGSVAALVQLAMLPRMVLWLYGGLSALTFLIYVLDKSSAHKGGQRVRENTLHLLALLGGWPGALYAQQLLRHKSRKTSFRIAFWATLLFNVAALGYLLTEHGQWLTDNLQRIFP